MKKRYLLIIIIVIVLALAAWFFLSHPKNSPQGGAPSGGSLPSVGTQMGNGGSGAGSGVAQNGSSSVSMFDTNAATTNPSTFGVVSDGPVASYFVDGQGNVTVVEPDGDVAELVNGQASSLSSSTIQNLIDATFSSNGQKVAISFGDAGNPQTSIFDDNAKTWTSLPVGAASPAWAPSGYQLAYLQQNTNGTESIMTVVAATSTVSAPTTLVTLHAEDLSLAWINKSELALTSKPSDYAEGSSLIYNITQKTLTPAILEEFGLETLWSKTTSSLGLAFSVNNGGSGGNLQLLDPSTGNIKNIGFLTLPTKCAFNLDASPISTSSIANTTASSKADASSPSLDLYCAIPQDSNELPSAKLPEDYNEMAIFTADSFYKMDAGTGALTQVFAPAGAYDASNLSVFNNDLFFINRYDQKLYAISLDK